MANKRFIDFPIAASVGNDDIVLIWQDGLNKQTTKATLFAGSPNSLAGLTDVDISALANGQILQYNSTTSKWENVDRTDIDLDELGDVTIVSPTNGQVLVYNSSTSKWENSSAGFVPYTGAVTTVNLGAQSILAGSFVKAGGTSAQFLKADGSVDSNTYLTTGSAAATYVPYTGATADVNLGTHDLTAERGTFQNNGSSDTLTVNHTSGSGYGIIVTKGGNGEALYVSKTSGSGNAMTVIGGRTSLVDLALSTVTNTAGDFLTLSGGVVHKRTAAEVRTDIGAGTVTSVAALTLGTSGTDLSSTVANGTTTPVITLNVPTASATNRGALSSGDWSTFNSKQAQLNGTGFVKASGTTISYDNTSYLPLTGGTLTGALGGTSASFSGNLTVSSGNVSGGGIILADDGDIVDLNDGYASLRFSLGVRIFSANRGGSAVITLANTGAISANGNITGANLSGTNTGDVTIGTGNGLSLSGQTLSLGLASGSANGALSSTDWTTFNNKQNALTNPVTGTGSAGQVAYWSSGSAITGESNLFWDATNDFLGIGQTPFYNLDVNGYARFTYAVSPFRIRDTNYPQMSFLQDKLLTNGNAIAVINFQGRFNSTTFGTGASINTEAVGNWSSTNYGASLSFSTVTQNTDVNTERMRITSSGNVGIGTPSPGSLVAIEKSSNSGSGSAFPRLAIKNTLATQGDGSSTFNFADILVSSGNESVNMFLATTFAAGTWAPAAIINVSTNHELQLKTNNTTRMTIASGGNVLIGTTSDNSTRLQVNGGITVAGTSALADNQLRIRSIGDGNHAIVFNSTVNGPLSYGYLGSGLGWTEGGSPQIALMNVRGNVLIGTTTDSGDKLRVNGTTFSNEIMTWNPENDNRSGVPWRLGAKSDTIYTSNKSLRVNVGGVEYWILAREV
jgi:hypothetical protein